MRKTLVLAFFALFCAPFTIQAQTLQCQTPEQKAQCQAALGQAEAEAKQAQDQLAQAQAQSSSLKQAIAVLDAKIKVAQANIKAKNLLIKTLGNDITQKQNHINDLQGHIDQGKQTLADILRKTNELDAYSIPKIALSRSSVSDFLLDLDTFQSVQQSLEQVFNQLRSDQASTTAEKNALDTRRNAEIDARYAIQQQQKNIQSDQTAKNQLLTISKGNESAYGILLSQKQAEAAKIRAALFPLAGGVKIPFGEALQYANAAFAKTGVRPAFILAVLTQESALGENVGTCYLSDFNGGSGVNVNTGNFVASVMNPARDVPSFLDITRSLGFDPRKTVVSCPQSVGWGGAMGPAQFIASTWVLLKDRVASALGMSDIPNPWNPSHAFMASALFLSDLGASGGGYTAERSAACHYFSGASCSKSRLIASYGNSVVAKADGIQQTINQL